MKQLVEGFEAMGWQPSAPMVALLNERCRLHLSTLPCGELIGAQEHNKTVATGRKFRRDEHSYAAGIRGKVLEGRCSFKTPSLNVPMSAKTEVIDKNACYDSKGQRSLAFNDITSTRQTAEWYSPSAQNMNTPHADLRLLQDLPLSLGRVWLNSYFEHMSSVGALGSAEFGQPVWVWIHLSCVRTVYAFSPSGCILGPRLWSSTMTV